MDPAVPYSRFPLATLDAPSPFDRAPLVARADAAVSARYDDPMTALVAPHVDAAHYRAVYPDIARSGLDPVLHFHADGWREGRDPNTWFDTKYYLEANPDIRAAGIDPLLHFVTHGRHEGRQPRRPGGALRTIVDAAQPPRDRPRGNDAPENAPRLEPATLGRLLAAACVGGRGLVMSVSHDRYIDITGGVQIFIADEQMLFNGDRFAYLHLSPEVARLTLAGEDDPPVCLQIVIDGRFAGLATRSCIEQALAALPDGVAPRRLLVVHSVFGHRVADLVALAAGLGTADRFFWLHDYATICEGYNLLRDDAVFCGAPPPASMQCRICVYGEHRREYRAAMHALFAAIGFHVLAPSQAALDLWRRAADLPHVSARVHANCRFTPLPPVTRAPPAEAALRQPVRVAFVGYPMPHKGWPLFLDLVRDNRALGIYDFYHFSTSKTLQRMDGLTCVAAQVDRYDRFAMVRALADHAIDLVLLLSPWPETFSYVMHEALAAGADVVALADSGNVADAVRRYASGVVLRDGAALRRFFGDLHAAQYARSRLASLRPRGVLHVCGTSATVDLTALDGPDPLRFETADPDLQVIAGDRVLTPQAEGDQFRFTLPEGLETIRLVSRSLVPGLVHPCRADLRQLGVAVSRLLLDGAIVPPGDPRRVAGWHGADEAWEWTSGDATVAVAGATTMDVVLERLLTYVRSPLAGLA